MDDSHLNRLAAELRNQIYELVLTVLGPISFRFQGKDQAWICDLKHKYGNVLAITETCKKIHNECHEMFYALNTFEVKTSPETLSLSFNQLRDFMGPLAKSLMRSFIFDIGMLDTDDWLDRNDFHFRRPRYMEAYIGFALDGLREVGAEDRDGQFVLKFKLYCLDDFELKLDARDLALAWDEKLAQAIPLKEDDGWIVDREQAIRIMKDCRKENQDRYLQRLMFRAAFHRPAAI